MVEITTYSNGQAPGRGVITDVELQLADGSTLFGVVIDKNIVAASLGAVASAVNRVPKRS